MPIMMRKPGERQRPGLDQDPAQEPGRLRSGGPFISDDFGEFGPKPPGGDYTDKGDPYGIGPLPPGVSGPHAERAGTEPRNNPDLRGTSQGSLAAPPRPKAPAPMAGSVSSPGVMPFDPLPSPQGASLANPARRGLYGSLGGLQGGGLGVPLDPVSDQMSDPISTLIQLLTKLGR